MSDWMNLPENDDNRRLFEYLRYNSYRSDHYKLFYVATPKVACTSLKWWFARLEGCEQDIRDFNDSLESDPDLVIHDTFHRVAPTVTGLLPEALAEVLSSDTYFRFAVVSNPYKRIFSAWQSKLLLREPLQVSPYLNCDFFNHPIEKKGDIAMAFEGFLEHLASNEAPDFWDYHWTPQAILLRPDLISYAKLVKIEETKELSKALADRLGPEIPDPFKAPRLNVSLIPYCREFLTQLSRDLIRSLYSVDFETFGYDARPPGPDKVLTDEEFELARKAIILIRGRHLRLGERYDIVIRLNKQLSGQEETIREKEASVQQKDEMLNRRNEALQQKTEELNNQTEKLNRKSEEIEHKNEELHRKNEEINQINGEINRIKEELNRVNEESKHKNEELRLKSEEIVSKDGEISRIREESDRTNEELKLKKEELDLQTRELDLQKAELGRRNEELLRTNVELHHRVSELNQTSAKLSLNEEELDRRENELVQKTEELAALSAQLSRVSLALNRASEDLSLKKLELSQKTDQVNKILTSRTWILTKPVRVILDVTGRFFGKIKRTINIIPGIIRFNGGIRNTLKKTVMILVKEGPGRISFHYKAQSFNAENAAENISGEGSSGTAGILPDLQSPEMIRDKERFGGSASVLFIGHDARLAGAQMLLLSLVRWLSRHTGIRIKIILLDEGVLLEKFRNIAPTITWQEIVRSHPEKEERQAWLAEFAGKVDLIYGNTVLSPTLYDELEFLHAPYITHVHELEKSIRLYFDKNTIRKMHDYTVGYIAGSKPVELNLLQNHNYHQKEIITINDFIEKREIHPGYSKPDLRKKSGLISDGLIVIGCGTIYWRKGVDLFVDTAIKLKAKKVSKFHFYWIGENIWDIDHASNKMCSWNAIEQKISDNGLEKHITFLGVKENFFDYFLAGDVFYLPSREDPFPLVCLEAAQVCMPVICFKDAGGMPDFVEADAGFVVPFEDTGTAAEKIRFLYRNPSVLKELGATAREKFLKRHSIETAAPEIVQFARKIGNIHPAVSIVVPNYNCEKFLAKRMESIFSQTFRDFEVIILDDASSDRSLEILEEYLHYPNVRLIKNQSNSGNPFKQWHKGFSEAKGEILWFAEADDLCEPGFLQKLLPNFNNPSVALTYCDSSVIDESGDVTGDYGYYFDLLNTDRWKDSYRAKDLQEINSGLGIKNTIPNASAVLIRKSCITEAIFNEAFQFKFSGDWFFYTQVIKGKEIAFLAEKLNYHRKHTQTLTSKFNLEEPSVKLLFTEQDTIHNIILNSFSIDADFLDKWQYHIQRQLQTWYPSIVEDEYNNVYPFNSTKEKIITAIRKKEQSRKLVFITTLDYSPNGGSEQLWIETAIESCKRGHEVMIVIRDWDPAPYFIQIFRDIGIRVVFKDGDEFNQLLLFQPHLVIVSTGDMDEGTEWYSHCRKHAIPYVIINQLTKEPEYWPIRYDIIDQVRKGYLGAAKVFFTCHNNHKVMEKRLSCEIPNAAVHFNPFHIDRNSFVPFPSVAGGLKLAIPANLSRVHKGQHLAIELFNVKKWRERPIQLHLYGSGYDEQVLKEMVKNFGLKNVFFHDPTNDLLTIWRDNHAIFMPSFMEGLPLVLVGAMICSRVPVLTAIGAHREVVDDNMNGFIAAKPSVEALDEALERAYQRSGQWEEIGKKAREKILLYLPAADPVDDFISRILPLAVKSKKP
ncbi:MAG: glycosyltransferase [Bacteroidetes bacterium]|nr:glycosyltransferase [Bacteroidota bacterium]